MLAFFGEEERHHAVAVVAVGRGTEQDIHGDAASYPYYGGSGVVARLAVVKAVALVNEYR